MYHRTGAHRAGLDGDVEITTGKPMISDGAGRRAHGDDFRVRSRVVIYYVAVITSCNDMSVAHDNRSNRYFAGCLGERRLSQRFLHPYLVRQRHCAFLGTQLYSMGVLQAAHQSSGTQAESTTYGKPAAFN